MTRFWCGWVFRRKLAIVLALQSFSVTRTCIAETLIKLLVGLKFACNHHEGLGYLYLSGVLISTASAISKLGHEILKERPIKTFSWEKASCGNR